MAHLIDHKMTNTIKGVAILIVVLGHYVRFMDNPLPLASHIPYFGAALFAFMSGYGTMVSYMSKKVQKWGEYFVRRVKRVFFPFLFINIIALPFYDWRNPIRQIFLGANDDVMWYPIFIMGFYIAFAICFGVLSDKGLIGLCFFGVVAYVIMVIFEISTQYYTSIFALLLGVIVARYEDLFGKRRNNFVPIIVLFLFTSIIIKLISEYEIKYLSTSIAGAMFSLLAFYVVDVICRRLRILGFLSVIGTYSYFAYLIHMKVFDYIERLSGTEGFLPFLIFLVGTIVLTVLFQMIWTISEKSICKVIKKC